MPCLVPLKSIGDERLGDECFYSSFSWGAHDKHTSKTRKWRTGAQDGMLSHLFVPHDCCTDTVGFFQNKDETNGPTKRENPLVGPRWRCSGKHCIRPRSVRYCSRVFACPTGGAIRHLRHAVLSILKVHDGIINIP
jgi:hypothetical protein